MVCRYINGPRLVSPATRLEQVCQGTKLKHQSAGVLDEMYLMILRSCMTDDLTTDEEQEINARLRHVLGSLVLLLDNLSALELQRLLFPLALADGEIVQETLDSLHAVFEVPRHSERPIQMQHLSFRDFLIDHTRCTDVRFYVDARAGHHSLFLHCRDLLAKSLKPNICHLASPGTVVSDVPTVALRQCIPPGLVYACRYWIDHVELGEVSLEDDGVVNRFMEQYCPLWLEVMCLLSKLPEAIAAMRRLESIVSAAQSSKLHSLVSDTIRFIYGFSYILTKAPLQLYYSGLFFSPMDSMFRYLLQRLSSTNLRVLSQLPKQWTQCLQTLEGHSGKVNRVLFSADGTRLASCSWDRTVRVWDVETGRCEHTLEGHSDEVNSVVFSVDGTRLASGSRDGMLRVWDLAENSQLLYHITGQGNHLPKFSDDGSETYVNGMVIAAPTISLQSHTMPTPVTHESTTDTMHLAVSDDWVTDSTEAVLWLPPEYRPGICASNGGILAIGSDNGRVTIIAQSSSMLLC